VDNGVTHVYSGTGISTGLVNVNNDVALDLNQGNTFELNFSTAQTVAYLYPPLPRPGFKFSIVSSNTNATLNASLFGTCNGQNLTLGTNQSVTFTTDANQNIQQDCPNNLNGANLTNVPMAPCTVRITQGGGAINSGTVATSTTSGTCFNSFTGAYTITAIKCFSDNNGASTGNAADSSGNALLTGAITAQSTPVAGIQSSHTTIAAGASINWTIVADGTSKMIECFAIWHY
jgi:hypothetical protein